MKSGIKMSFDLAAIKGGTVPTADAVLANQTQAVSLDGHSIYFRTDIEEADPDFLYADPSWCFTLNNRSWFCLWPLVQFYSPTAEATGDLFYTNDGAVLSEYQTQQIASEMSAARMLAKMDGSWLVVISNVLKSEQMIPAVEENIVWIQEAFEELRVFLVDARGAVMH